MWIRIQYAIFNFNDYRVVEIENGADGKFLLTFKSPSTGQKLRFQYDTFRECTNRLNGGIQVGLCNDYKLIELNDTEWYEKTKWKLA